MQLSDRLLKIAAVYFMAGSMLGLIMGIMQDFREVPVHAHLNLLGWASLGLIALLYRAHPQLTQTKLAKVHFWLHNLGLPVGMVALFFYLGGDPRARPIVALGSVMVAAGVGCFVANVIRTLRQARNA
jgi:hypothetical protein